jgi:hypothetical protein
MTLRDHGPQNCCLKEQLLSTTSISDKKYRRWTDGHNGNYMLPQNFLEIIKTLETFVKVGVAS